MRDEVERRATCPNCKHQFSFTRSDQVFCSDRCRVAWNRKKKADKTGTGAKVEWGKVIDKRFSANVTTEEIKRLAKFFKSRAFSLDNLVATSGNSSETNITYSIAANIEHDLANFLDELATAQNKK